MKKIMVFIGGYLPGEKYGGQVTSISNFVEVLGDEYDIKIVCSNHDFKETTPYSNITSGWNSVGKAKVLYLKNKEQNYKNYLTILKEIKPDLIYCSGIMYIKVNAGIFKAARKSGIPILLAPRGDICGNALKIKKWKKIPFLELMKKVRFFHDMYFHATMEEEVDNLKKYLEIDEKYIYLLQNLPSSPVCRKTYQKEKGTLKVIFISRIQEKKNLLTAIKIVNALKGRVQFDIYGPLENSEYWRKCQDEIEKAPQNVHIEYKGALSPKEAKMIYTQYDCFLFPTYSENYGHVIAESIMHDCPVVISKGTTPWDDIAIYNAGYVVDLDNYKDFINALEKIREMDNLEYNQLIKHLRQYVTDKINLNDLKMKYLEMLNSIIESYTIGEK